jgi:hypothetical protein
LIINPKPYIVQFESLCSLLCADANTPKYQYLSATVKSIFDVSEASGLDILKRIKGFYEKNLNDLTLKEHDFKRIENAVNKIKFHFEKQTTKASKKSVNTTLSLKEQAEKLKERQSTEKTAILSELSSLEKILSEKTPIPASVEIKREFQELLSRLERGKRQDIENKLGNLPDIDSKLPEILELIKNGDYSNPWLQDANFDYYVLYAVKTNQLTRHQFGTVMYIKANLKECVAYSSDNFKYFKKPIKLFNGQETSKTARMILYEHIKENGDEKDYLDMNQLDNFFKLMQDTDLSSEKQFFLIPDNLDYETFKESEMLEPFPSEKIDIVLRINELENIRLLDIVEFSPEQMEEIEQVFGEKLQSSKMRIVPSLGMMQAFLDVKFSKEQSMKINPVLGLSPVDLFFSAMFDDLRDMGIPFDGEPLPEAVDGYKASPSSFVRHDFYHNLICSIIPRKHRLAALQIASQIKKVNLPEESCKLIDQFWNHIIDMEYGIYKEGSFDLDFSFWFSIFNFNFILKEELINNLDRNDGIYQFVSSGILEHIANFISDLVKHPQNNWEALFGIDIYALVKFAKKINNKDKTKEIIELLQQIKTNQPSFSLKESLTQEGQIKNLLRELESRNKDMHVIFLRLVSAILCQCFKEKGIL